MNDNTENTIRKPLGFFDDFTRKPGHAPKVTHYCPGCGHGRVHKLIAEAMETLGIIDKTVFISPVGCSVFGYYYFHCGNVQSAHGRAPAVGTGLSRANPESIVISYQGDGDLGAIGTAEILHAANRGENMTVIFINNGIYGMTGGQMAPTSLLGQKTATSPTGRDSNTEGFPMKMSEIISTLEAPVFVERTTVSDTKGIMKTKRAIIKALESQKKKQGFSFVEILSACPVGWKLKPTDAVKRLKEVVEPYFAVKNFKDETATRPTKPTPHAMVGDREMLEILGLSEDKKIFDVDPSFVKNFQEQKLRIAGFGGQGVLMAGTTLGYLALYHGLNTTWLPSYGPEMRGGTANCHVVLSNKTIGAPVVESPNVLIAMNGPSLDEFEKIVVPGGMIIVNSSIITRKVERKDVKAIYVPMSDIAEQAGLRAASNMAAVTAYLAATKVMSVDTLIKLIKFSFKKPDLVSKNIEIIEKAHAYIKEHC